MNEYLQEVVDQFCGKEGSSQDDVVAAILNRGLDLFETVLHLSSLAYYKELEAELPKPIKPLLVHDAGPEPEDDCPPTKPIS